MKILKVFPLVDHPFRYNYAINYGVWDQIPGDEVRLECFDADLNEYDVVFLPFHSRWKGNEDLLEGIKEHRIKKVLFDNDSCYRSFKDPFYRGMDFIFYRCKDKDNRIPECDSSQLLWSINHEKYTPQYGGEGVLFSCSVTGAYPLRKQIAKVIKPERHIGQCYIERIQQSAGAIHTDSPKVQQPRAKILEFAACGTNIISNRCGTELYFPNKLLTLFDTIDELRGIVKGFRPDVKVQKQLREVVEAKHTDEIRAEQILNMIQ